MRHIIVTVGLCLGLGAAAHAADLRPTPKPVATPNFNGWSGPLPAKPPCSCRHAGGKAMLGETTCMKRNGRMVTMRCTQVLNNTAWEKLHDGCDLV